MFDQAPPAAPALPPVYVEDLDVTSRGWVLFAAALALTALAVTPRLIPVTALAWAVNVARYRNVQIRVDLATVQVGGRRVPLSAFDPSTLDRASNAWPWTWLRPGYLGANPIWTRDSVSLSGSIGGKPVRLNVGTNHREHLVAVLLAGIERSRALPVSPWGPPQ